MVFAKQRGEKNLVLGHDIPTEEGCTERVLSIYESEISIVNCDIFGCGITGFSAGKIRPSSRAGRPLKEVYAVVFMDAILYHVRSMCDC